MRMSEVRVGMRFINENGVTITVYRADDQAFSFTSEAVGLMTGMLGAGTHHGLDGEVAPWLSLVDE